jgi:hypothetical protein
MASRAHTPQRVKWRKTTATERQAILDAHYLWLETAAAQGRRADLTGASPWGTHLEGADLRTAIGLTPSQLASAHWDEATHCPRGLAQQSGMEQGTGGGQLPARRHGHRL